MGFDPDAYLKKAQEPGFDPDAYLMAQAAPKPKTGSAGQAFIESYGNTASFGYLPHMQALAEKVTPNPTAALDAELKAKGFQVSQPGDNYLNARDANIQRQEAMKKDFPVASGAGTVAGVVGSNVMATAAAPWKAAATLAGRLRQSAKVGAAAGAIMNPGDVEGELSPLQFGDRAKNAAFGAGTGILVQGGAEAAGPLARKASEWAKMKAEQKAVRAAGANKAQIKDLRKSGREQELGRTLLDEDVVTPLSTPRRIEKRLNAKIEATDEKLTALISDAESKLGKTEFWDSLPVDQQEKLMKSLFDPKKTADELKSELIRRYNQIPRQKIQPALDEIDVWFANRPKVMSPAEVQSSKVQMNKFLKDSDFKREVGIQKEGTLAARRGFKEGVEKNADALAETMGKSGGEIKKTNRSLGNLIEAKNMAENRVAMDSANRSISLTDTIAGAQGIAAGTTPVEKAGIAALSAALNKTGRTFGASMQARGFDRASKVLAATPALTAFAQKNPVLAQVLVNRLTQAPKNERAPEEPIIHDQRLMEIFRQNPQLIDNIQDESLRAAVRKAVRVPASK